MRPTRRQREVISDYLATGSIDQTAQRLHITPGSVRRHIERARRRGHFATNEQMVHAGTRDGWIAVLPRATDRSLGASEG